MDITIDLNSVVPITIINTVNKMDYPLKVIKLSKDTNEFSEQLTLYINEYVDEFSEVLKQQFMVRLVEHLSVDLKKQGISIIYEKDS